MHGPMNIEYMKSLFYWMLPEWLYSTAFGKAPRIRP